MAVYVKQKKDRWLPEEVALLRIGQVPEGRTLAAARAKAKTLGITLFDREGPGTRWTPDEIDSLEKGVQPPGRSQVACTYKGISLGLDVRFDDDGNMYVTQKVPGGDRRKSLLERARKYAMMKDCGQSLAEIGRRDGVSRQRVNEIIGELTIRR